MERIQAESIMNTENQNPYIGPRTFRKEEGHLFFGRDREARDLTALVVSEKIVLFYAQSGAGKSSLINTRLIPDLEEKLFEVLPVARVSGDAPQGGEVENIYVYNLIRSLLRRETDPRMLSGLTLPQFLAKLNEDENGYFYDPNLAIPIRASLEMTPWPRALIIDQFEEVFSTHVEAWEKREDFFHQLAQAMQDDPYLRLILVMREDYIASLDPYAHLLPGGLRVRYYMQRLGCEAAIQAVKRPVEELRPYTRGVAEKLVDDLSSIKVQKPDGTLGQESGQYIEPVQLQVVCYSLWQNLPAGKIRITMQDLREVGDVDTSLGNYYADRVKAVAETYHVNEHRIRQWFSDKLISPGGIRNMVLMEPSGKSVGLENSVIQALPDLIRIEQRGGAFFYELTHDRLVKPILENNQKWVAQHLNILQRGAVLWNDQDRSEGLLLRGRELTNAENEARNTELTDLEKAYLNASRKLRTQELKERKRNRWLAILTFTSLIGLIAMCIGLTLAVSSTFNAINSESTAQASNSTAQASDREAKNQLSRSESLRFALQAKMLLSNDVNSNPELASLLSIKSLNGVYIPEADAALVESLDRLYAVQSFAGHTDEITSVAISKDGKYLATGSYDNTAKLWDIQTGNLIQTLNGHENWVSDVAFSPDGRYLLTGSFDNTAKIWDLSNGTVIVTLSGHSDTVLAVAYSPEGNFVLTGSNDKTAKLWDVRTGQEIYTFNGHEEAVWNVAFSPDSKMILTGSQDMTAKLWDFEARSEIYTFQASVGDVYSVAFSPSGKQIVIAGRAGSAELWDVESRNKVLTFEGHRDGILEVAFSHNGYYILTGSFDGTAILWSSKTGEILRTFKGHSNWVNDVAFSPDDQYVFTGSSDKTAKMWLTSEKLVPRNIVNDGAIEQVVFAPDGQSFLTAGSYDNYAIMWSTVTGKGIHVYKGLNAIDNAISISADGKNILAVSNDGIAKLWDAETGSEIHTYLDKDQDQTTNISSAAISPSQKYILIGDSSGRAILWDMDSEEKIHVFTGHAGEILDVAFSPDEKYILTGSTDTTAKLWDMTTGKEKFTIESTQSIWSVAFSPDGKYILTGSLDSTARLWDTNTGKEIRAFLGHGDRVFGVAFSHDGKYVLTGSADKTAKLWNTDTGELIRTLNGHTGIVDSVDFSPADQYLVTASEDGTARLWDFNYQTTIVLACSVLKSDISPEEREHFGIADSNPSCPTQQTRIIPVTSTISSTPAEIESLLYTGNILETLVRLGTAQVSDPNYIGNFDADFWNLLCWDGSLEGYAVEVKYSCERAVALEPDNGNFKDSRGLNRALQGNFEGAIEDFNNAVNWFRENDVDEEIIKKREYWISALQVGQNPFDAETLEALKSE
jgi:WD40 repeat protein